MSYPPALRQIALSRLGLTEQDMRLPDFNKLETTSRTQRIAQWSGYEGEKQALQAERLVTQEIEKMYTKGILEPEFILAGRPEDIGRAFVVGRHAAPQTVKHRPADNRSDYVQQTLEEKKQQTLSKLQHQQQIFDSNFEVQTEQKQAFQSQMGAYFQNSKDRAQYALDVQARKREQLDKRLMQKSEKVKQFTEAQKQQRQQMLGENSVHKRQINQLVAGNKTQIKQEFTQFRQNVDEQVKRRQETATAGRQAYLGTVQDFGRRLSDYNANVHDLGRYDQHKKVADTSVMLSSKFDKERTQAQVARQYRDEQILNTTQSHTLRQVEAFNKFEDLQVEKEQKGLERLNEWKAKDCHYGEQLAIETQELAHVNQIQFDKGQQMRDRLERQQLYKQQLTAIKLQIGDTAPLLLK